MRFFSLTLLSCCLMLSGCTSIPMGISAAKPSIGGYFPGTMDAMWSYDQTTTENNATTKNFVYTTVKNMSQTGDTTFILIDSDTGYKITKDKVYVGAGDDNEQIPLPLKVNANWSYKIATNSIQVKITEEAEITVPAGRFKTMHIVYTDANNKTLLERWLADGVGQVKLLTDNGTRKVIQELNSYHL